MKLRETPRGCDIATPGFWRTPLANFPSFLGIGLLTCLLLSLIAFGCTNQPTPPQRTSEISGIAMTVPYHITFADEMNARSFDRANRLIEATFQEVNAVYNQWNPSSEISALNRLKAGAPVTPSDCLYRLLLLVDQISRLTEGRYDPTIEPLKKLWVRYLSEGSTPPPEALVEITPSLGWHQVHLVDGKFWKDNDTLQINLDSISKGLCVDMLVERLTVLGFHNVLVEWGGEIRASGQHVDGRPWRIFISRLGSTLSQDAIAEFDLDGRATATSGDYLQYWVIGDKTYFHLFDPKRLCPLELHPGSIASATVQAQSCALADALATAALLFESMEDAQDWAKRVQTVLPNTTFWLVNRPCN